MRCDKCRCGYDPHGGRAAMKYLPLCESAKKGHACIDDLCRGASVTLCGFDQDDYDAMTSDEEDFYHQEDEDDER